MQINKKTLYFSKENFNHDLVSFIQKLYEANRRTLVLCNNQDSMHNLDRLLWTTFQTSFLPHATEEDSCNSNEQQIFLCTDKTIGKTRNFEVLITTKNMYTQVQNSDLANYNQIFLIGKKDL